MKKSYLLEPFFTDKKIIVTGGCGFIGSNLIRRLIRDSNSKIFNIDKLSYASDSSGIEEELSRNNITDASRYELLKIDLADYENLDNTIHQIKPDLIFHLAAESHVDRSILKSDDFIQSNIIGTYTLLEVSREYWDELPKTRKKKFRFHHVSTDEVYGELNNKSELFNEKTSYKPNSPYSASKAGSDHLVRAWGRTYNFPFVITNCSNNYGPFQYPEKLIPKTILNALNGKKIPVYAKGNQIRDWLYVDDHVSALVLVAQKAKVGQTYNIGGNNEMKNIKVVKLICEILEETLPLKKTHKKYKNLIEFVKDRPGHDLRYAIDTRKIYKDLGWKPRESFKTGIRKTIKWYLVNKDWWKPIIKKEYK